MLVTWSFPTSNGSVEGYMVKILDDKPDEVEARDCIDWHTQTLLFVGPYVKYCLRYPHLEILAHVHVRMSLLARSSTKRTHSRAV